MIEKQKHESPTAFTLRLIRAEIIEECANVIGEMRQREATMFDEKHSGQRGCDRLDALYDAYRAVKALADSSGVRALKS